MNDPANPGFKAMAFAADLPGGSAPGQVSFTPEKLYFSSAQAQRSLDLVGLQMRMDGSGGREVFLSHPELPGWQILVLERGVLQAPELLTHPHLAAAALQGAKTQKKMSRGLKFLLWSPLWILGMLVALFLALKPLAAAAVNKIPRSAEAELGNILWKTTSSRMILEPEVPKEQREKLDKAWQRLLPQVKDSGYDFKLHLVQDNTPNAFALPGGHMAVHTGLLKLASTPEQVAGVLSHEIAHITLRHSLRNIVQEAGLQATLGILLGGTDLSGLGEVAGSLKSLQYGREMEREADEQGFEYLLAAKIDPSGLIQFFELLRQESAGGPEMPSLLSTHPATQERIARLQELLHQIPKDFQPHPL